jgi:hypothetical protein
MRWDWLYPFELTLRCCYRGGMSRLRKKSGSRDRRLKGVVADFFRGLVLKGKF